MEVSLQSAEAVLKEEFEGDLIIDEGKKPAKSQKRKTNGEKASTKASSSAALVEAPPAPVPEIISSQPDSIASNEPEIISRSGRKIKPKR